jgi:hypothetical protein
MEPEGLNTRSEVKEIDTRTQSTAVAAILCPSEAQGRRRVKTFEYACNMLFENISRQRADEKSGDLEGRVRRIGNTGFGGGHKPPSKPHGVTRL